MPSYNESSNNMDPTSPLSFHLPSKIYTITSPLPLSHVLFSRSYISITTTTPSIPHSHTPLTLSQSIYPSIYPPIHQSPYFESRMSILYQRPYQFGHGYDIFRIPVNTGVPFRVYRYFLYIYIYYRVKGPHHLLGPGPWIRT